MPGAGSVPSADSAVPDAGVRLEFYNPLHWRKRLGNLLRDGTVRLAYLDACLSGAAAGPFTK